MSPYQTRLQVKLAANAVPVRLNHVNVAPVPINHAMGVTITSKKYNTRLQLAISKECNDLKVFMDRSMSRNNNTNIDSIRACFEYLQTSQKLWRNHLKFRTIMNNKIIEMLNNQIPNRLKACAPESEVANKLVQLRCTIEKVQEILHNYYMQQKIMYA
jgi:hypothetical protein